MNSRANHNTRGANVAAWVQSYAYDTMRRLTSVSSPAGAFVYSYNDGAGNDYHWYRQDSGGGWSHKPGWGDVTDVDASGNLINDPCKANRDYRPKGGPNYSQDCGDLCVPN